MVAKQVTDKWVADELATALRGSSNHPPPDEGRVGRLTERVNLYLATPWTQAKIAETWNLIGSVRRERSALIRAADILRRALDASLADLPNYDIGTQLRQAAEQHVSDLETAISVLEGRCSVWDSFALSVHAADRGRRPPPWALTAAGIADEVHRVFDDRGSSSEELGGPEGPVTRFVAACLREIFPPDQVPTNATINGVLNKYLTRSWRV